MRVLVTRPQPAASATAESLAALGHEPLLLPLARTVHDRAAGRAALERPFDALVVTSAEALRAIAPMPVAILAHRIYCTGPATAGHAAEAGFTDIVAAEGTGLSLAARIAAEQPGRLLYLAGEPRSPDLEEKLGEAGMPLETVVCYRMEETEPDAAALSALIDPAPEVVLLYSRESALRFFRLPVVTTRPDRFDDTRFLCISEKTASVVPNRFAGAVTLAANPSEDGLFALLPRPSSQI